MADCNANSSAAIGQEQDVVVEKKYGGMAPKKPLISKVHTTFQTKKRITSVPILIQRTGSLARKLQTAAAHGLLSNP
ncbi:uncharacterized protein LOC101776977 isoform X4 [Setaria italica]|nr:uncharacterized protein LOC101776977 isoform X4 [Setaria italica]XP_034579089.1 uncharacterized protein LOC117842694 isoform X3 [Setaria viridis]XP_034579090.1 uncharacterized protein LOC117842694 isoform X3 [Setaria viridis]